MCGQGRSMVEHQVMIQNINEPWAWCIQWECRGAVWSHKNVRKPKTQGGQGREWLEQGKQADQEQSPTEPLAYGWVCFWGALGHLSCPTDVGPGGCRSPTDPGWHLQGQSDGNDITLPSLWIQELVPLPSRVQDVFNYKAVMTGDNG